MNQLAHNRAGSPLEAVRTWLKEGATPHLSILYTLLDAHLLFGETGLSIEALQSLFEVCWPQISLIDTLTEMLHSELLMARPGPSYTMPQELRPTLATQLGDNLAHYPCHLPNGVTEFEELVGSFAGYLQSELKGALAQADRGTDVWGGQAFNSSGRRHLLLLRPCPLRLHPHPEACILMLCQLPDIGIETITEQFARKPALRHRLALYDLEKAHKINLTRSDVFVYFERYLRRVHGLRVVPAPALTQTLIDSGLLSLEKG